MNTIWKITKLYVAPTQYQFPDVVVAADWQCTINQDQYSVVQTAMINFTNFVQPLMPLAELTEDQVLGWVWNSGVNKDEVESDLVEQLNREMNPPIINPPLPWAS